MGKIFLYITIITATLLHPVAQCQYYFYNSAYYEPAVTWEAGLSAGGMNCLTDLGGRKGTGKPFIGDVNWKYTQFCATLYVGWQYKNTFGARLECSFGQVAACDGVLANTSSASSGRYLRNLSFRSTITEAALVAEWYPLLVFRNSDTGPPALLPYVYAGIGYFGFMPQAMINNSWINLPSLHTEGQGFAAYPARKPYRLAQFNLPAGAGIQYDMSPVFTCRLEITYRKLWTDYLDDVSSTYIDPAAFARNLPPAMATLAKRLADRRLTSNRAGTGGGIRGNDKNNDTYFSFNLKAGFVFGRLKTR